jgi:hypothetical protein
VFRIGVAKVDRDVAKVDRDIANVAMAKCFIYIRCMLQVFSSRCCKSRFGSVFFKRFKMFHTSFLSVLFG